MTVIFSKWPKNIPTFFIPRPSIIYPNLDFRFDLSTPTGLFGKVVAAKKGRKKCDFIVLGPWWDSNPGLLFLRWMRGPHRQVYSGKLWQQKRKEKNVQFYNTGPRCRQVAVHHPIALCSHG
jgi:hypothetical protein